MKNHYSKETPCLDFSNFKNNEIVKSSLCHSQNSLFALVDLDYFEILCLCNIRYHIFFFLFLNFRKINEIDDKCKIFFSSKYYYVLIV